MINLSSTNLKFENNAQVDKNGDHVENAGVSIKIQSTWKSKYETNIQP